MRMIRNNWKIVAALAVILMAGAGMGYGLGKHNSHEEVQRLSRPEDWNHLMMRRLGHHLELTPEQWQQTRPMLRDAGEQIYLNNRRTRIQNMQVVRGFYEELETILDEEQQAKLDKARERIAERTRQQRANGTGPNIGGPGNGPKMGPGGGFRPRPPQAPQQDQPDPEQ